MPLYTYDTFFLVAFHGFYYAVGAASHYAYMRSCFDDGLVVETIHRKA